MRHWLWILIACGAAACASPQKASEHGQPGRSPVPAVSPDQGEEVPVAAEPAPVSAPVNPVTPCAEGVQTGGLLEVMLEPGNQWTYTYFEGWHSALSDWGQRTYTAQEKKTLGPYAATRVRVEDTSYTGETRAWTQFRIVKDATICMHNWAEEKEWELASSQWVEKVFEEAYTCWKPESEGKAGRLSCRGALCGPAQWVAAAPEIAGGIAGPAGFVVAVSAEYSAHTGDGTGTSMALTGYRLKRPMPTSPVEVSAAPETFTAFAKGLGKAGSGGMAAVKDAVAADVTFSINPEHEGRARAMESWGADKNRSGETLARLAQGPCGQVRAGGAAYVVCPRVVAEEYAAAVSACGLAARPTRARAVFEEREGAWLLTGLFLGGSDDLYANDESDDTPPIPLRQFKAR